MSDLYEATDQTAPNAVGQKINALRLRAGIGLARLASAVGISEQRLGALESGVTEATRDELISLALTLGCDANTLRPGTTEPFSFPPEIANRSPEEQTDWILDHLTDGA